MRRRESEVIQIDLLQRCDKINSLIAEIELRVGDRVSEARIRLQSIMDQLQCESSEYRKERIEMEIALLADRVDITEELVRLRAHAHLFGLSFVGCNDEPVGQKLAFLLHEMQREASTIGSKANSAPIAHCVVLIKQELEKIREQVQNLR